MALVTISEASRLTGKARKTLYAHIKSGKVTSSLDKDNVRKIDTSELVRVYDITIKGNNKVTPEVTSEVTQGNVTGNTINLTHEELKEIIKSAVAEAIKEVVPLLLEHKQPDIKERENIRTTKNGLRGYKPKSPTIDSYLDDMTFVSKK